MSKLLHLHLSLAFSFLLISCVSKPKESSANPKGRLPTSAVDLQPSKILCFTIGDGFSFAMDRKADGYEVRLASTSSKKRSSEGIRLSGLSCHFDNLSTAIRNLPLVSCIGTDGKATITTSQVIGLNEKGGREQALYQSFSLFSKKIAEVNLTTANDMRKKGIYLKGPTLEIDLEPAHVSCRTQN